VLVVDGAIVNDSKRSVDVPRLRFAVRDQDGHEINTWVLVRFFNRRDLAAGVQ